MTRASRITALCTGLALGLTACQDGVLTTPDPAATPPAAAVVSSQGRYIVQLRDASALASVGSRLAGAGASVDLTVPEIRMLAVSGLADGDAAALAADPAVLRVAPDLEASIPPDALATRRVSLPEDAPRIQGTNQSGAFFFNRFQWYLRVTQVDQMWDVTPTGAGVLVCVLDTGIDPGQLDLAGRVDLSKSASFVPAEPFIEDLNFHGTGVASLISSNGIGMASVAPDATLCGVKVLNANGSGAFSWIIAGMIHAANVGADVINMSLGAYVPRNAPGVAALIAALDDAVSYVRDFGSQVVAAAGNSGANLDEDGDMINLPSELKGVISVAATAPFNQANFDQLASYSNFGGRMGGVDLSAPGGDLLPGGAIEDLVLVACSRFVCGADGFYVLTAGTSFASPLAAGVSAVAESHLPGNQKAPELDQCLRGTTDIILHANGRRDLRHGLGRLNGLRGGQCSL
jgi:subtilisin family serine protease